MGDLGLILGLGRSPGEGKGYTPVFWPGEFHGLYSPWGHKESDTTEQLSLPVVMYGCESWAMKKAEHQRTDVLNCGVGEDS